MIFKYIKCDKKWRQMNTAETQKQAAWMIPPMSTLWFDYKLHLWLKSSTAVIDFQSGQ